MVRRSQDSIQLLSAESDSSESTSGCPAVKLPNTDAPVRRPKFYRSRPNVSTSNSSVIKKNVRTILTVVAVTILTLWIIMLTVVASSLYRRVSEVQELTNRRK